MPEGDTIHKIANFLAPRMVGERVHTITVAPRFPRRPFAGDTVRSVEAHGKHLYIGFAGGPALRRGLRIGWEPGRARHNVRAVKPATFLSSAILGSWLLS